MINGGNAGVTASVVQNGAGFQLQLVSNTTGAAGAFTVQDVSQNGKTLLSTNTNMVQPITAHFNMKWSVDVKVDKRQPLTRSEPGGSGVPITI
ncbi:hypothetical protein EFBL_1313 [Effusibacillus lacus]|uniref:Uncharacterized protein n=2 Tax=Effusibacillus lacus TaxID=1348429 RepID=A0A292YLA7_9BACL|nr:hypothetical protein EFBL_1313 [Effusibacillus lacus]